MYDIDIAARSICKKNARESLSSEPILLALHVDHVIKMYQ